MFLESQEDLGVDDVPTTQFTSRDWHDLEVERLWRRVWQVACRVEELEKVGDHVVYEIGDDSLIVVRSSDDEIRAFHNACLHRGTQLRGSGGRVKEFRCPFHGFTWHLDGSLARVPCPWDFPHVDEERFCLPQARVEVWGGFVFVNMDPGCESLEAFLEVIPEHLAGYRLEDRYKAVHVSQVVPCNWKVALEAFLEGYHVAETHPQVVGFFDCDIQYDVFPEARHTNRLIMLGAVPTEEVESMVDEQVMIDFIQSATGVPEEYWIRDHQPGDPVRHRLAEQQRQTLSARHTADLSGASDSDMLDQIQYYFFPNVIPWPTVGAPITYRFRPYENDPHQCLMEVMFLYPRPEDGSRPVVAKEIRLAPDQAWSSVEALGPYGPIFDQDMPNLRRLQRGLRAARKPGITLSRYQESRIRHFHRTLDQYVAGC
jgi:phenylpropionate dioxygenase-like ring-hydroxylating dioxygenase large terminal subunit